jgi:drug/metabolite transporter (DMT)-like permease
MVAMVIYILCAATCCVCAFLLLRHYKRSRAKLLFWSGLCFVCFAISNILLFVDLALLPSVDLSLYRNLATLFGLVLLAYGLITETV